MAKFDVTQPQQRDSDNEWTPLDTDSYIMKITAAKIAPSRFANDDGEFPDQLTVVWSLADWNQDYDDAGYQAGQKVFQQMAPWYGEGRKGASKLKQFVDPLIAEELIPAQFEIAEGDTPETEGDLIGITRQVMVEKYLKTMGANKGQPGNRVMAVTKLPTQRSTLKEVLKNGGKVDIDDIEVSEQTSRLEYLTTLYTQATTEADWSQENLAELATDLADFSGSDDWKRKKYGARNATMLQNDIKTLWGMIQRNELVANPDRMPF